MDIKIQNIGANFETNDLKKQSPFENAFSITPDKIGKYSKLKVAIIDDFNSEKFELLNIPHGKLVQKYITENLPGVQIEPKNITLNSDNNERKILELLKNILNEVEQGKKYDAINMSVQTNDFVRIDTLKIKSDEKEIQLTNENINQYRNKLKKTYQDKFFSLTKTIESIFTQMSEEQITKEISEHIETLEKISESIKKISDKGIKIFIANNNECATKICYSDLFDLDYENCNNPNIITVSANDCKDSSSSLSDIKERSIYKFNFLEGGIDVTGDGIIDIHDKYNIGKFLKENIGLDRFEGNSIAAPVALAKYLKEKYDKENK